MTGTLRRFRGVNLRVTGDSDVFSGGGIGGVTRMSTRKKQMSLGLELDSDSFINLSRVNMVRWIK